MTLYEEIVFLKYHSEALWVVENVVPYYPAMMDPQKINRHLYWASFTINDLPKVVENLRDLQIPGLQKLHGIDLSKYKISNKRQILRNCVLPETGLAILQDAIESTKLKEGMTK
jgi:DNA (cytosine-5)-methyltransferase 1